MYNQWSYKILSTLGVIIHLILIDIPCDLYRWLTLRPKDVTNQVIAITGAGSGLGRRMAEIFSLEYKAKVAAIDINKKAVDEAVASIKEQGGEAASFKCDIGNSAEMNLVADKIRETYGKVDIVICNAAVLAFKFFMDLSDSELKRSFDVNVIGTVNTIRAFLGEMEKDNNGHIVTVASIAGFSGETYGLAYCPSKFAVRGVMECLQMELRDMGLEGIKVTTLCPYFARTPMVLGAGLRPTCTWFPFMSVDSCSRRMVDSILKEKVLSFVPNYVTFVPMVRGLLSINTARSLREYLGINYEPSSYSSQRKVLPRTPDFFAMPPFIWWILIPGALTINYLALVSPSSLKTGFLPVLGPAAAHIALNYRIVPVLTNYFALFIHLCEAIFAMLICDRTRMSFACSFKWFLQTLLLGFPSLQLLQRFCTKLNT